ncbi:ankyrin repeat and SOCS box protein 3 [Poeciliopsis prolifica]|uniref:ankyrin repeat and SOCS box protein 3 n=1 Tax=Poeciliopsis prolifica TaxID=188132 RepID=UPI00241335D8|nr:ankyrin repeat and SOCS box protein 3 [Poeciliopsis prolifica]XP_054898457.1 ankyrin repeat and SOCS box protein 3 [Poeciliopsis prolifica]
MDFTECYEDTVSSVAAAARSGCRRQLRRLIQRGCSVDSRDNRGWNPLHEAAAAGSKECVEELLSAVIDSSSRCRDYVNTLTHEGESACYLAAQRGHLAVVKRLLKVRADIDQQTNDLSCPVFAAVDNGHTEVVKLLIRKGAQVKFMHTKSWWTCLHQAVYKGHSDIVRILVDVCNIEAHDDHRISPLFLAAQYGQKECLEILINAGANVNTQAADLATPLLIASQEGHEACVDLLLSHGADPNLSCSKDWPQFPIHAAAEFGHISILKRLIEVTDRTCDQGEGMVSPLYVAIHNDQTSSIQLLLKEGYSPDAQECANILDFPSPLSLALYHASTKRESIKLLLNAGATLNAEEWTYALATVTTDLLELILDHRWIPRPEAFSKGFLVPHHHGKMILKQKELRELVCVALSQVDFASCWLSILLNKGLEPSLLLHPHMLEKADSDVLNYLLEFVNWSTLSTSLKIILNKRREEKTWEPHTYFASVPCLFHLCRLKVREVLGPDQLMRTNVVQQLAIPTALHNFLKFKDIQELSFTRPPPSPVMSRILRCRIAHEHRHVV